jgi:hypothetical protein
MLKEILPVRQIAGEQRRRWFAAEAADLVVWVDAAGAPVGFQLCYDRDADEKALTWRAPDRFSHNAVDDGEGQPFRHKGSPILGSARPFDAARVTEILRREGAQLPADIAALLTAKIAELGDRA